MYVKTDVSCDSCDDRDEDDIAMNNLKVLLNELVDLSILENVDKCKKIYNLIRQNERYRYIDDTFIEVPIGTAENLVSDM